MMYYLVLFLMLFVSACSSPKTADGDTLTPGTMVQDKLTGRIGMVEGEFNKKCDVRFQDNTILQIAPESLKVVQYKGVDNATQNQ